MRETAAMVPLSLRILIPSLLGLIVAAEASQELGDLRVSDVEGTRVAGGGELGDGGENEEAPKALKVLIALMGIFLASATMYWLHVLYNQCCRSKAKTFECQVVVCYHRSSLCGGDTDDRLTTAVVTKIEKDDKVGLTIGDRTTSDGTIIPVIVNVDGLALKETRLQPGMKILTVNGKVCKHRDHAFRLLRDAGDTITITASCSWRVIAAEVHGMNYFVAEGSNGKAKLQVGKIRSGPAPTGLVEGMPILQINGVNVRDLEKQGLVTATAVELSNSEEVAIVVALDKPLKKPKRGKSIEDMEEGKLDTTHCTAGASTIMEFDA